MSNSKRAELETPRNDPQDADAQDRSPRTTDARQESVRVENWKQPDILPMPDPQPGWVFRYIRTSTFGQSDNRNVSMRFREGWEPVKLEDYPELMIISDHGSEWGKKGAVEIGGLLLCKAPEHIMKQRKKHYEDMAKQQMRAIDSNLMKEADPRMPILAPERSSQVLFGGSGR
jgi:hypothetical protein